MTVEHSSFSDNTKELKFNLGDVSQLQDAQLLFAVKEGTGDLIIMLNGEEIFRGDITVEDLPMSLPYSLLKPINKLTFGVSSPGINIFRTNRYVLRNVQVYTKTLQENKQEARTFVLSKTELTNLHHLTLFYTVNCFTVNEQGRLLVALNGKIISDGLVVCDAGPIALDIDPADLIDGTNVLQFQVDRGKYVLEQLNLEKAVGHDNTNRYVFTMQVADFQAVQAGAHIVLDMKFVNDGLRKIGAVYINGYPIYVDTYDIGFGYDITGLAGPGTNIVRIVPEVPFEIVSMNIGLA